PPPHGGVAGADRTIPAGPGGGPGPGAAARGGGARPLDPRPGRPPGAAGADLRAALRPLPAAAARLGRRPRPAPAPRPAGAQRRPALPGGERGHGRPAARARRGGGADRGAARAVAVG